MTMTADDWNARYPIGTPVIAYPGARPEHATGADTRLETVTRTAAWTLGHGAAVVAVEGYAGGIALTHIDPIDPAAVARQAAGNVNTALANLFTRLGPPTNQK